MIAAIWVAFGISTAILLYAWFRVSRIVLSDMDLQPGQPVTSTKTTVSELELLRDFIRREVHSAMSLYGTPADAGPPSVSTSIRGGETQPPLINEIQTERPFKTPKDNKTPGVLNRLSDGGTQDHGGVQH